MKAALTLVVAATAFGAAFGVTRAVDDPAQSEAGTPAPGVVAPDPTAAARVNGFTPARGLPTLRATPSPSPTPRPTTPVVTATPAPTAAAPPVTSSPPTGGSGGGTSTPEPGGTGGGGGGGGGG